MDNNKNLTFNMPEHILYDFISSFPEAAHLKDVATKKYLHSNIHNLKVYGLNDPKKVVGLTVHDLDNFMKPYWGEGFAAQITEFDLMIKKNVTIITDKNRVFLDKFGLVHIQNMTKAPICNKHNKVSAILTMSFEITNSLDRLYIFEVYKKIYKKKKEACLYFLKHLKITKFLKEILSDKEIICLLNMIENKSYKWIAAKMSISHKTVETHINNIINKIQYTSLPYLIEFIKTGIDKRE